MKIHGRYVPVEAEVVQLDIFSAHADQADLLACLAQCKRPPRRVYLTHGEVVPSDTLRLKIEESHGFPVRVPEYRESVELA